MLIGATISKNFPFIFFYNEDKLIFFVYFFYENFLKQHDHNLLHLFFYQKSFGSPYNFYPLDNASVTR